MLKTTTLQAVTLHCSKTIGMSMFFSVTLLSNVEAHRHSGGSAFLNCLFNLVHFFPRADTLIPLIRLSSLSQQTCVYEIHLKTAASFIMFTYSYITIFLFFMNLINTLKQVLGILKGNTDTLGVGFQKQAGLKLKKNKN